MERTTLTFDAGNTLTVCLMVFLGFTIIGVLGRLAYGLTGSNNG